MPPEKLTYPINRTSLIQYDVNIHSDNVIPILFNDPVQIRQELNLFTEPGRSNAYLKSLKCNADIPNLPEQSIPNLGDGASDLERYAAQKQVEWHSPRFHVAYWLTKKPYPSNRPESNDWFWTGHHSVVNVGSWRQYDPYDFFSNNLTFGLEEGDRLGFSVISIQILDANGIPISYFPRTLPPYELPANRADKVTFICEWTQELLINVNRDVMTIYVAASGTTSNTTPVIPPAIAVTVPTGTPTNSTGAPILYASENSPFSFAITKLQPNTDFFVSWIANAQIYKTDTFRSDANGNYTVSATSQTFAAAPYPGTAEYVIRVTQGSVSTESSKINIRVPTVTMMYAVFYVSSGTTAEIRNVKPGTTYQLSWVKNGADLAGSIATYTMATASDSQQLNFPSTMFNQTGWGTGKYRIRFTKTGTNLSILSNETDCQPAQTGGAKG